VHELATLQGGTLTAESEVDQGSVFRVFIPAGMAHLPPEQISISRKADSSALLTRAVIEEALSWLEDAPGIAATDERSDGAIGDSESSHGPIAADAARPRIVLADDNADMRSYVARILQTAGYDVLAVPNGEQALQACGVEPMPDLVLTDVMMPGLDGFGLLRALRANPAMQGLLVILLSARAGEEARVEGLVAGADDYLVKPFSARELLARVDGAIRLARQRCQAAERERQLQTELTAERGRAALRESEALRFISEEKYRLLLEQAHDAILLLDISGRVM
jgi:DNA-binding response OmpR family regulator